MPYVIVVTWARGICLICMPEGRRAEGIHIRQITSAHVTSNMYHFWYSKNLPKLTAFALPIYITMSIRFDYGIST